MSRSVIFNLMGLASSFQRYERELPLKLVMSWLFGAMNIAKTMSSELALTKV
jgi:hypothetical protein